MKPGRFRAYENFHIVLWLLKDTCWVSDFKTAGLIMIFMDRIDRQQKNAK
ncbi:MAG: hypothetical protein ACKORE_03805 [Bacteroidota bacterium]